MQGLKIAIIGCGVGGACTALELAKYAQDVTIFESSAKILNRTSAHTPGRLGLGFHYPGDYSLETAKTILSAAIVLKQTYPSAIVGYKDSDRSSLSKGWYFLTKDSQTSSDAFLDYCSKIRDVYNNLCITTNTQFFGHANDFYRILLPSEYEKIIDKNKVILGIETHESIINWPILANQIKQELSLYKNIHILTNHRVLSLSRQNNVYKILVKVDESYDLEDVFDIIINSSCDYRISLDHKFGFKEQKDWVNRLKFLVQIKLSADMSEFHSMFFARGPFAMFTNAGEGVGYCTYGPSTNREQINAINYLPQEWENYISHGFEHDKEQEIGLEIISGVSKYIPHIKNAKLARVIAGVVQHPGYANIYDPNSDMHVRNKTGIYNYAPGYYSLDTGKLSFAPYYGKELCKIISKHI